MSMTNCPNCGAVRTGDKCEYCGTVFNKAENKYIDILLDGSDLARAVREHEKAFVAQYRSADGGRLIYQIIG